MSGPRKPVELRAAPLTWHHNPAAAGRYADEVAAAAELVIGAVHFEDADTVRDAVDRALIIPAPAGVDPAVALATVLAAQIDPDTTPEQRLGWTRPFADPAPTAPQRTRRDRRPA